MCKKVRDEERIVITGMGVIAPGANNLPEFKQMLDTGLSAIKYFPELREYSFRCQVAGKPALPENLRSDYESLHHLFKLKSSGILYGLMAAEQAWKDADLAVSTGPRDMGSGVIFGTGSNGIEATKYGIDFLEKLGAHGNDGTNILQALNNGVSSYIGYVLNLGNLLTTNASACNTGTEAILMASQRIKAGLAKKILVGSSESDSPYVWAPFDSMFATAQGFNSNPEQASCPMSAYSSGFVPSAGAGALVIESLSSALDRGARIYAELLGGQVNSGGQRGDGSMTIGNTRGMVRCIKDSVNLARIEPTDIDLLSGHLSSTVGDIREVTSWKEALGIAKEEFPYINSTKSLIGHCLSASGSIETVASVLQLYHGFIHTSLNGHPIHPQIEKMISPTCVPGSTVKKNLQIVSKISLGFGDVNSCIILKKWISS